MNLHVDRKGSSRPRINKFVIILMWKFDLIDPGRELKMIERDVNRLCEKLSFPRREKFSCESLSFNIYELKLVLTSAMNQNRMELCRIIKFHEISRGSNDMKTNNSDFVFAFHHFACFNWQ